MDRGVESFGKAFQQALKKQGRKDSVNQLGYCTDNGHMESYFCLRMAELIRETNKSMAELRYVSNISINHFYNNRQLHLGIGRCSTFEFMKMAA